jgi:hypothetical protein
MPQSRHARQAVLQVGRQDPTRGAAVARGGQEGLEPVADHGVEEGPFRLRAGEAAAEAWSTQTEASLWPGGPLGRRKADDACRCSASPATI